MKNMIVLEGKNPGRENEVVWSKEEQGYGKLWFVCIVFLD